MLSSIEIQFPFILTMTSYVSIITTILRIPSTTGKEKALSTCSSHLVVVIMFYKMKTLVSEIPKNLVLGGLNKVFSVFCAVLSPLSYPPIYMLRNKEVKKALRNIVSKS